MAGSQDIVEDPLNQQVLVYVNGALFPRERAMVSVFDAGFGLGDGVWEGIRLHRDRFLFLDAHLDRLLAGAAAIRLENAPDRAALTGALRHVVAANDMRDGVHCRIMLTRGLKATVNQDPRNALGRPTLVITAEHKQKKPGPGLALATVATRCTPAAMFDMRLNSHSRLNLIRALLEAIGQGADEALMLDPDGCVASCNATNFFWRDGGVLRTAGGDFCFNGITRGHVIGLARAAGIPLEIGYFPPRSVAAATEAFVTGTLGGITPVRRIDGRDLPDTPGALTRALQADYAALMDANAA